jgi:gamma-glutamylcyclotransferase (GGCT)/AIG2-like uncharacterized protein YtfP
MTEHDELRRFFFYGTLRNEKVGKSIGLGSINGLMYDLLSFPGVSPHPTKRVVGEVHDFNHQSEDEWNDLLRWLDRYEGVPILFRRERVNVTLVGEDDDIEAYVYFFNHGDDATPTVPSGDWHEVRAL